MVIFKNLKFKNFLSTGNYFTEIELNKSPSTLVVGQNGAGKSTMLDALSFALFGSPHRNISKKQLVNSINNKNCIVMVEFDVGEHEFKIVRGIKPNVFEIWQNGKMINQSSTVRDYQKYLEQNILKLNHKSFHQIVVLGSSSFIPFMQLKVKDRREVIEDLLDINIFTKMNQILKEKMSRNNEELRDVEYQIDNIQNQIKYQKKYIQDISLMSEEQAKRLENKIQEAESKITQLELDNSVLQDEIDKLQKPLIEKHDNMVKQKSDLSSYSSQFKSKIKLLVKDAKFYEEHDNCPICSQTISPELKEKKLKETKTSSRELQEAMSKIDIQISDIDSKLDKINEELENISNKNMSISGNNREIYALNSQIDSLHKEMKTITKSGDLSEANDNLSKLYESFEYNVERKSEINDTVSYDRVAQELLKDTGIKTKVVKEYIPVINKLVNQYLQILDFFVSFNLDENFNESIKSRHRDEFNYDSFSEGEKQRIDLSLMFTWRQISKMKNSTSTNLLILDETFDSSLDDAGIENLFKILRTLGDDSNTFIISHKGDILEDKFPSKIEFYKDKNFSKMR